MGFAKAAGICRLQRTRHANEMQRSSYVKAGCRLVMEVMIGGGAIFSAEERIADITRRHSLNMFQVRGQPS